MPALPCEHLSSFSCAICNLVTSKVSFLLTVMFLLLDSILPRCIQWCPEFVSFTFKFIFTLISPKFLIFAIVYIQMDFYNHYPCFLLCFCSFVFFCFLLMASSKFFYVWMSSIQNPPCVGAHVVAYIIQITVLGVLYIYLAVIVLKIVLTVVHLWTFLVQKYALQEQHAQACAVVDNCWLYVYFQMFKDFKNVKHIFSTNVTVPWYHL